MRTYETADELPEGVYRLDQETAWHLIQEGKAFLLDVRTPEEYREGHIEGATLIPVDWIVQAHTDGLPSKDTPMLLYCRAGKRAQVAAEVLGALGWKRVANMGGTLEWPYGLVK